MSNKPKRVTVENATITNLFQWDSYGYGPYRIAKHNFNNVVFKGITVAKTCIFDSCSFTNCKFINCTMEIMVVISKVTFDNVHFINCDLTGSKFYANNFVNCPCCDNKIIFSKCNVRNVDFDFISGDILFEHCLHAPKRIITEETIIGYKYTLNHLIILEISENTRYIKSTSDKCRAERAKVVSILNTDGTYSGVREDRSYNYEDFVYRTGEIVYPTYNFDPTLTVECSTGIHFFLSMEQAKNFYNTVIRGTMIQGLPLQFLTGVI